LAGVEETKTRKKYLPGDGTAKKSQSKTRLNGMVENGGENGGGTINKGCGVKKAKLPLLTGEREEINGGHMRESWAGGS